MGRRLNRTVLAGGVVYPAGTPEADVKADVDPAFWSGKSDAADSEDKPKRRATKKSAGS